MSDISDINSNLGMPCSRRSAVKAGLAFGGLVCASLMGGCSLLGIENPNDTDSAETTDPGVVDFESLEVSISTDPSYWQWLVYENSNSANNGKLVVKIPVSAANADDSARVLSDMYCYVVGPSGEKLDSLANLYSDDIRNTGSMSVGTSTTGYIYFFFQGSGSYTVQFDNLLGRKPSATFDVNFTDAPDGTGPFPANLNSYNMSSELLQGTSFEVGNLTIAFTSDNSTYTWVTVSAPGDDYWDGRNLVGVPVRVTNNCSVAQNFNDIRYQLYSPYTNQVSDGSSLYPNSVKSVLTSIAANQTAQAVMYIAYDCTEATHYCVFCNDGIAVTAGIWIP